MLLVATVEHSGTMRTLGFLNRQVCPLEERHLAHDDSVLFAHLEDCMMPLIEQHDGPILTTRRDEAQIFATWKRRGRDLSGLDEQIRNYRRLLKRGPYILELGKWQ